MTSIEWTQRPGTKGETWNPLAGCSVVSPGCILCYAMRMAHRIQAMGGKAAETYAGTTRVVNGNPVWTGKVNAAPESTLLKPLRWREPRTVFVNSMSDLFHESVPDDTIDRIFAIMALTPQHTYQVLTKRSARMRAYFTQDGGFGRWGYIEQAARKYANVPLSKTLAHFGTRNLPNVWLGVSAERQQEADERIPDLLVTPAAIRFVSAEPLLGPIDLRNIRQYNPRGLPWIDSVHGLVTHGAYLARSPSECSMNTSTRIPGELPALDWIIVGGESGPGARPMHPAWARSIRDQCAAAGTAFFFKQWGAWAPIDHSEAADDGGWQGRGDWMILDKDGGLDIPDHRWPDQEASEVAVVNVGKSRAGRLLDGAEHSAWPAAALSSPPSIGGEVARPQGETERGSTR